MNWYRVKGYLGHVGKGKSLDVLYYILLARDFYFNMGRVKLTNSRKYNISNKLRIRPKLYLPNMCLADDKELELLEYIVSLGAYKEETFKGKKVRYHFAPNGGRLYNLVMNLNQEASLF